MIYHHLFEHYRKQDQVNAALIGAGHFGTAIVAQQTKSAWLNLPVVADKSTEAAQAALEKSGIPKECMVYCDTAQAASQAVEQGKFVYTDHPEMVAEIDGIDIICESTGSPEAATAYALAALENGKSVAMITKDCDAAVGPILKKIAKDKGLVYTPVDGDQHGLLMGMVEWAHIVGLEILSAGKATDGEFIWDEAAGTVRIKTDKHISPPYQDMVTIPPELRRYFSMIPQGGALEYLEKRAQALKGLPPAGSYDLCEMVVAANATGLYPEKDTLHQAAMRITELPVAYCPQKLGGIMKNEGVIDLVTCLRRPDEAGLGGGVFMVVNCENDYANYILTTKGQIANYDNSAAVVYRPYHLCGAETTTSLLCAGLLGVDTGSSVYLPKYDLVRVAARDIPVGEAIGGDHSPQVTARILPATPVAEGNPAAAHLVTGNKALVDIPAGTTITYDMVEEPKDSVLWNLRRRQDKELM